MAARALSVVSLFTRKDCTLCDSAKFVIKKVQNKIPFQYEEVDIAKPENAKWHTLYTNDIPVIHVNGKEVARHRLNEPQFIADLQKASE